jgi:hypothetical protein
MKALQHGVKSGRFCAREKWIQERNDEMHFSSTNVRSSRPRAASSTSAKLLDGLLDHLSSLLLVLVEDVENVLDLRGDNWIRLDRLGEILAVVGNVVYLRRGELAIPFGPGERVRGGVLREASRSDTVLVRVFGLLERHLRKGVGRLGKLSKVIAEDRRVLNTQLGRCEKLVQVGVTIQTLASAVGLLLPVHTSP